MASFKPGLNTNYKKIEEDLKPWEVFNLPLNNTSGGVIGEGSSAIVYKHTLRKKTAAVKKFKNNLSKKSILKASLSLLNLQHVNVVRFRGYSTRPSAILFEYCHVDCSEDETVHT